MITKHHPDGRIEIISPFDYYLDPAVEILKMTVTPIEPEDPQRRTAREFLAIAEERERFLLKVRADLQRQQIQLFGKLFDMWAEIERARDPRLDPKEGDELRKRRTKNGEFLWRHVTYRRGRWTKRRRGIVCYFEKGIGVTEGFKSCSLKDWRAWAKGATVKPKFPGAKS